MLLIRRKKFNVVYVKFFESYSYEMDFPDQDILNYVHWKKVGYAEKNKYNFGARSGHKKGWVYEDVKEKVAIVHFTEDKPWTNGDFHYDIEKLWWEYAKKSTFYNQLSFDFITDSMTNNDIETYVKELKDCNAELLDMIENTINSVGVK